MQLENNWNLIFQKIDNYIQVRDFAAAEHLIDASIKTAYEDFVDPRFILKELRAQKIKVSLHSK